MESSDDSDNYYVIKLTRTAADDYSAIVPYSTGNADGKFFGADNNTLMFFAYRAYVDPSTGVGPSCYEIIYDRAIVSHKKQAE